MKSPDFGPLPFTGKTGALTPEAKAWLADLVRELATEQAVAVTQDARIASAEARVAGLEARVTTLEAPDASA